MSTKLSILLMAMVMMYLAGSASAVTSCSECTRCYCKCFDSFFDYKECKKISISPSFTECAGTKNCCGLNRNVQAECIRTKSYLGILLGSIAGFVCLIIIIIAVCRFCNRRKTLAPVQTMGTGGQSMMPSGMMHGGVYMPQQAMYGQPTQQMMFSQQPNQMYGQPVQNQFAPGRAPIF